MSDWFRMQLARYTYRPGWTLEIEDGEPSSSSWSFLEPLATLRVGFMAADSRNPGAQARVTSRQQIPEYILGDEEAFARWLQHVLFGMEQHESREWLRRDGEIFDDPHARTR